MICSRCKGEFPLCGCCKSHPSSIATHIQPKPSLDNYDTTTEYEETMLIEVKKFPESQEVNDR